MSIYKGQQKITPIKVVKKGGDYYVEQVNNADGTCILNITDADSVNKWKEQLINLISAVGTEFEIPDGTEIIRTACFYRCSKLEKIIIPSSIKYIGIQNIGSYESNFDGYSFYSCRNLKELDLSHLVNYVETPFSTSCMCQNCYKLISLKLPPTLKTVGQSMANYCHELKNVEIPDTVTEISYYSFGNCQKLEMFKLPLYLEKLGPNAFYDCSSITINNIPSKVTIIPSNCFINCTSLTEMTFNGSITMISSSAFQGCTNLTKFSFPNNTAVPTLSNVNAIPNGANFTGKIAIPNTLYDSWTTASNWSSLTQAQWIRFINSWNETITAEGDYALFNDTSLTDVRHLAPTTQTYNVTLHNYADMFILNGNPTVEQNSEYVVTIEKTDRVEWPAEVAVLPTYTPYITINGVELSSDNYTTVTTTYKDNTYPTTITIKPNVINGDVDISLIYSNGSVGGGEWDMDPFI